MSEKSKNSDRKIREMTKDIVNELLKSGDPVRIDISTGGVVQKCGAKFIACGDYTCKTKFRCTAPKGFSCTGGFIDSADYTLTV